MILHRDQYSKDINELKYANTRIKDIREKAAEHFAMAFLIPAKVLRNYDYYFDGYIDRDLIIENKKEFGVIAKSLIMTLNTYGYIDGKILGALFKKLKEFGFDKKEPDPRDYIRKNLIADYFKDVNNKYQMLNVEDINDYSKELFVKVK